MDLTFLLYYGVHIDEFEKNPNIFEETFAMYLECLHRHGYFVERAALYKSYRESVLYAFLRYCWDMLLYMNPKDGLTKKFRNCLSKCKEILISDIGYQQ